MSSTVTDWARGAPPSEGWWNASTERCADTRRWWSNDKGWSAPCYVGDTDEIAERAKNTPATDQAGIEWRGLREPRS